MKNYFIVPAVVMALAGYSAAGTGTAGAQFLNIVPSARASALGDTAATITGAESLCINPAGLSKVEKTDINFSQVAGIESMSFSNFAAVKAFGFGNLGLGVSCLSVPEIKKYDNTGADTGDYAAADTAVTVGFAKTIEGNLSIGADIKAITCSIDGTSASSTGFDLGVIMNINEDRFIAGASIQNAGTELKFVSEGSPLATTLKMGARYGLLENNLYLSIDTNSNSSGRSESLGAEYRLLIGNIELYGRLGYNNKKTVNDTGVTAGIGVGNGKYLMDIALMPSAEFGTSTRISLGAKF